MPFAWNFKMQTVSSVSPVSPLVVPLIIELLARAPAASLIVPVACQSAPMDPPRSKDPKSVISVVQGFHEEVRARHWWESWCSLDIQRNPVGDGSRPTGVCEVHYVASPLYFRRLGPCEKMLKPAIPPKLNQFL
ncbi:unnamed protein product [Heligmosomoides polygyrus]|uniref:Secreted protein n=1 Tax=Heligmosomoides polygyrus TaxID=6339 RepID=A0A183FZ86_HELPZ|nr:unnamed protein product [Heligmosomoides polygyrus]